MRSRVLGGAAAALLLSAALLRPAAAEDARAVFEFLRLVPGARQAAMGGAGTAVADDVAAVRLNPAAVGRLWRQEVSLARVNWVQNINGQSAAYALPTIGRGNFAVEAFTLDYGNIPAYNGTGQRLGSVSAGDMAARISYGFARGERWSAGATVGYAQERLHAEKAQAVFGDLGMVFKPAARGWLESFQFGAAATNIGTEPSFGAGSEPLPRLFRFGTAYRPYWEKLTVAADVLWPSHGDVSVQTGIECRADPLALRAGYDSGRPGGDGLSLGLGLKVKEIDFGYAYAGFLASSLGSTHHITLSYRFGSLAERHYQKGIEAMRREDYPLAVAEFGRALAQDPNHDRALDRLRRANTLLQEQTKSLER